ncbi:hypothetical protein ACFQV8_26350 [Pseudonocardia benzenivorans]
MFGLPGEFGEDAVAAAVVPRPGRTVDPAQLRAFVTPICRTSPCRATSTCGSSCRAPRQRRCARPSCARRACGLGCGTAARRDAREAPGLPPARRAPERNLTVLARPFRNGEVAAGPWRAT